VTKWFGDVKVLDRVSFNLNRGERAGLIGPNGCGKTTLLRMINRLIEPTSGEILVDGVDTQTLKPYELRRRIGYAIQGDGLFPHRTVAGNIGTVPPNNLGPRAGNVPPNNLGPRADSPYAQVAPAQGLGSFVTGPPKDQTRLQSEVNPATWNSFEAAKQNRLADAIRSDMMSDDIASYDPLGSIRAPAAPAQQSVYGGYGTFDTPMGQYAVDQGILGAQRLAQQQNDALLSGSRYSGMDPATEPTKTYYDRVPASPNVPASYNPLGSFVTPRDMQDRIAQGDMYGVPTPDGRAYNTGVPTFAQEGTLPSVQMVRPEAVGSYPAGITTIKDQSRIPATDPSYFGDIASYTPAAPFAQQVADPRTGYISPNNVPPTVSYPPSQYMTETGMTTPTVADILESYQTPPVRQTSYPPSQYMTETGMTTPTVADILESYQTPAQPSTINPTMSGTPPPGFHADNPISFADPLSG
jgi:ABC-type Fe3+/spermidine/putrescine transport system ATPase subunit